MRVKERIKQKPIDLYSVAERIRLFGKGIRVRFTKEELDAFESIVAVTDISGGLTKHPEWKAIEKKDGFNKVMNLINDIRVKFGFPSGKDESRKQR